MHYKCKTYLADWPGQLTNHPIGQPANPTVSKQLNHPMSQAATQTDSAALRQHPG